MKRLYYGVVSVQVGNCVYNEFGCGICESEGEFVGKLAHRALKEHRGGRITNTAAFPIDDEMILEAARFASREGK